jgi:hypothetical protein
MVARVATASKCREKCKNLEKPILVGIPWSPAPLCATVQIREFLGAIGFCQVWIHNYSLLAKPLYEATKRGEWKPMVWGEEQEKACKEIKRALINTPALGLPDVIKPFFLHVHESLETAIGVLTQLLGSWHHSDGLFTKAVS